MNTLMLQSEDIHCETCASKVKEALNKVEGVTEISVNVPSQTVSIEFDMPANEVTLRTAMDEAGFAIKEA